MRILKIIFLYLLLVLSQVFIFALLAAVLLIPVAYLIPSLENYETYSYLVFLLEIEGILLSGVRNTLPTVYRGTDITRRMVLLGAFLLSIPAAAFSRSIKDSLYYSVVISTPEQTGRELPFHKKLLKKFEMLFFRRESELRKLQRKLARIKEKIDKLGKQLTFLSIDVVNSTSMKRDEDPASVEYYFNQYNSFVKERLNRHRAVKTSWTPDGVMSCFGDFESAFLAAKEIIEELPRLNNSLQQFKHDFVVRCGINSGFIYFDDMLSLQEMAGHSIDLAGHFQKYAAPNSIYANKTSIPLHLLASFKTVEEDIDGCRVMAWHPERFYDGEKPEK